MHVLIIAGGRTGGGEILCYAGIQKQEDYGMLLIMCVVLRTHVLPTHIRSQMHIHTHIHTYLRSWDCGIHPGLSGMDALPYTDMIEADEIDLLLISQYVRNRATLSSVC